MGTEGNERLVTPLSAANAKELVSPSEQGRLWRVWRALAHRNYRLFLIGQSVSLIGTWMQQVAMTWVVYQLTGSPFLLGLLGFFTQIPSFFLAPFAGVLTDRWNRHRSLLITQALAMLQACALVALVATQQVRVEYLFGLGIFLGVINAFDMPLRQAFLSEMVTQRDDLANAIALNSSIVNGARLVGPSLAGLLLAAGGEVICFLLNALSYVAVLGALFAMRDFPAREARPRLPLWKGLREGFVYAFGFPPIRSLLLLLGLMSMVSTSLTVLLPVFATQVLEGGAGTLGFLMAASGGGALLGALYLASRKNVLGLGVRIVAATAGFGLGLIAFTYSRSLWISLPLLVVTGFSMMVKMAASNTILQTIVEEDKRGRVMSFYTMAFLGMAPVGSLLAGLLSDWVGPLMTFRIAGGLCIAGGGLFFWRLEGLRRHIRPIYQRAGILPAPPEAPGAIPAVLPPEH